LGGVLREALMIWIGQNYAFKLALAANDQAFGLE
jgi:hypothetical protein